MRVTLVLFGLMTAAGLVGCGSSQPTAGDGAPPLTVEQWKALPVETKYEIETLERLKQGDPNLQDQRAWDKFTREVLLPAKKKDFPDGKKP